jgi:hypothetical protein
MDLLHKYLLIRKYTTDLKESSFSVDIFSNELVTIVLVDQEIDKAFS